MPEPTADEIIEHARRQIAHRPSATIGADHPAWRSLFLLALLLLLPAVLVLPGSGLDQTLALVVSGLCDQRHTLVLGGKILPLCARDTGIYLGFGLTLASIYGRGRGRAADLSRPITFVLLAFVVLMGIDGVNSLLNEIGFARLYTPDNRLRTLSGLGMGVFLAVLQHLLLVRALRRDADLTQQAIRGWGELGVILSLGLLVQVLVVSNIELLYWPLALATVLGIVSSLFLMFLLLAGLALGYRQQVTAWSQLARPAVVALLPTLLLVGGSALLRLWLSA